MTTVTKPRVPNTRPLFSLNYLDKIADAATGGALHFEPGLWMTQPPTSYPDESAQRPDRPPRPRSRTWAGRTCRSGR